MDTQWYPDPHKTKLLLNGILLWNPLHEHVKVFFNTLLIPCGKFKPPCLVTATAAFKSSTTWAVLQVHAGSFRVSAIHWTLTWTTGFLTCAYMIILTRAYTHGDWAHWQWVSTTFFDSEIFYLLCSWWGLNSGHGIHWVLNMMLYQLSHPLSCSKLVIDVLKVNY